MRAVQGVYVEYPASRYGAIYNVCYTLCNASTLTAYGTRHVRVGGSLVDRVHRERIPGGEPALRRERNPLSTPGGAHSGTIHHFTKAASTPAPTTATDRWIVVIVVVRRVAVWWHRRVLGDFLRRSSDAGGFKPPRCKRLSHIFFFTWRSIFFGGVVHATSTKSCQMENILN